MNGHSKLQTNGGEFYDWKPEVSQRMQVRKLGQPMSTFSVITINLLDIVSKLYIIIHQAGVSEVRESARVCHLHF